jgi:hypothetical protein
MEERGTRNETGQESNKVKETKNENEYTTKEDIKDSAGKLKIIDRLDQIINYRII